MQFFCTFPQAMHWGCFFADSSKWNLLIKTNFILVVLKVSSTLLHNRIPGSLNLMVMGLTMYCRLNSTQEWHQGLKQLPEVMTRTSTKRSYSYQSERHTGRLHFARYFTPPLAFSVHYRIIFVNRLDQSLMPQSTAVSLLGGYR